MKKIIAALFVLGIFQLTAFGQEKLLNWEVSLSTGIPVHTSSQTTTEETKDDLLFTNSFYRVIAGGSADVVLNFTEPLKAVFGIDSFCEFIWEKQSHYNSLDYSLYAGIKLFPNLAGFNASVSYVIGSKSNFIKSEEIGSTTQNTSWGNGFRISVEYDFFYGEDAVLYPIVGGYYRYMPRGDYTYDHVIAAYVGLKF